VQRKLIATSGVAGRVAGVAARGPGSGDSDKAVVAPRDRTGTVTVWLMNHTQTFWSELVTSVNAQLKAEYPKINVKVGYQQWGHAVRKPDAAPFEAVKG
jgi:N,N'-diacetylchitobiose transport system substrate-binding protein